LGCTSRAEERSSLLKFLARIDGKADKFMELLESVAYWDQKARAWQRVSKVRSNDVCDPMAQDGPEDGSDALNRPQNIATTASAEQITAGKVAPLKGRTVETMADGSGFSDFPITATKANPRAMATRKIKNKPTGVKRSRSLNPAPGPSKLLEPGQPDTDEDSTR
jgi:hypothetical protein